MIDNIQVIDSALPLVREKRRIRPMNSLKIHFVMQSELGWWNTHRRSSGTRLSLTKRHEPTLAAIDGQIIPEGPCAANLVGLSTQVPAKIV